MVNPSGVWDARHYIYWFATAEAITLSGAPAPVGPFLIFKA